MPDGAVRGATFCRTLSDIQPCKCSIRPLLYPFNPISMFKQGRRSRCDTTLSNESDRVYGMLQTAGGRVHLRSKMKRLGYIPCILTRSETPQPPAAVRLSYVSLIRPVALQYCQPLPLSPPPPLPSVTLPRQLPSADQHSVKSIFNG
jgi:hypothetical protein